MIVVEHATQHETLKPKDFDSEKQLEEVVRRYPELLMREGDARLSFVTQQIQMSSGIMDVVMIDSEGLPVAVEVKLGRNAQARREIVGQLVDYVSTMTEYTVDEFDDLVGGKVSDAIDMIRVKRELRPDEWHETPKPMLIAAAERTAHWVRLVEETRAREAT